MSSLEDGFKQVLVDFKKRLKPEEKARFSLTSLNDLQLATKDLQDKQTRSKTNQNLTRIQPFLNAMMQYKDTIEVFLNTSTILCFIWGPMKFMLLTACNWAKSFDILLDAYKQLAENFPLLLQYRSMFQENDHMKKILVWIYEDILKFHLRALRVFTQPAWKQFFNASWKDFQESSKAILNDMTRHRELIERKASLELIQESRDARVQAQASFANLEREANRAKTLAVVNWLSVADAALDQEDFASKRQLVPESGRWILEEPQVQKWLDTSDSSVPIFWLTGIPGAGKTILASVIIEECLARADPTKNETSVAYFYCRDHQDGQQSKLPSVARSLLTQMLQQNPEILAYLYDECLKSAKVTLSSLRECTKLLGDVLRALPRTFIVIDGIDECEQKERRAILNFFVSAISDGDPGKIRGFFVSQELNDIKTTLKTPAVLHLTENHNKNDIKKYTLKRADEIQRRFKDMPDEARDEIVRLVCTSSDGMFLFAKLVLDNLYDQQSLEDVSKELQFDTFPQGFDQAYKRIVTRIFQNPNIAQQRKARQLLGWITCAKRSMKWQEIQGVTSIDVNQRIVNFEGRQLPGHIREICGSLIDILPGNRIELVHRTARQYLLANKLIDEHKEEQSLALLCMQYLTFDCFDLDLTQEQIQNFVDAGNYAFLDYASLHWNHHLETALPFMGPKHLSDSTDLGKAVNEFFEMYHPGSLPVESENEYRQKCGTIERSDCYESVIQLLSHAKSSRLSNDQLEALGTLGTMIVRVRAVLKELRLTLIEQASGPLTSKLEDFYGDRMFKCSRHACYYFHEGFSEDKALLQHTTRHEKPFCCTEIGCTRMYIGWGTEKELKKHMSQVHPKPNAFAWKFPNVKKPPTMFQCKKCTKQFTRASSLNTHHLREHASERPFTCSTCGKGFVRKYECDRHATTHASKEKQSPGVCEADQEKNVL